MENEVLTITAPPEESVAAEPASEATEPVSQETAQPQETGAPQGREAQPTPSNGETRKPSEYYRDRQFKKEIESLKKIVSDLQSRPASTAVQPVSPASRTLSKIDPVKLWENPTQILSEVLAEHEKLMREEFKKELLEKDIPNVMNQTNQARESERNQQDALELIFPKSSADDKRTLVERVNADPKRRDQIQEMLNETGLEIVSQTDPVKAARTLMKLMEASKPPVPKNPNAIKKTLVGSTATGSPSGAGDKKMATLQEIKSQLSVLDEQVGKNPDLRYEDSFIQKRTELKNQLSALAKELGKNQ